ncbi:MAG: ABC transporter permease subunit, partial [Bacteriovoracaceae bacterium]|nr:ABC transporter permease subunit [Bacteriovoracaceae bacterium]
MGKYLLKRLLVMIPTLIGVTLVVFAVINLAPGSPVEQKLQQLRFGGGLSNSGGQSAAGARGSSTVSDEVLAALNKQYGFDKPLHERYLKWLGNIIRLDFGESFTYDEPVIDVIISKFPISLQFGIVSLILSYLISVPLGIMKALKHGSFFDTFSSFLLFVAYSIPPFMLAILLIVFMASDSFLDLFPIGGAFSDSYSDLSLTGKILDRIHHFILPLVCYTIGSFTSLTLLMKNSLLEEI